MSTLDRLERLTQGPEAAANDVDRMLASNTVDAYRDYLAVTFGFVAPLELRLQRTAGISAVIDLSKLAKRHLLERDLGALDVTAVDLSRLDRCPLIPDLDVLEALGWMYVVERTTHHHGRHFRKLAAAMPGELAFASSYLKCYASIGWDAWLRFGAVLDRMAVDTTSEGRIINGVMEAYECQRCWRAAQATSTVFIRRQRRSSVG